MPDQKPRRRKASDMGLMPVADQKELAARLAKRGDIRKANDQLVKLVIAWILDGPLDKDERKAFLSEFHAQGHAGEYLEVPSSTTQERAKAMGMKLAEVLKRLDETPLDFMGALELSYAYDRIMSMIEAITAVPRGTTKDAIVIYRQIGSKIRQKVYAETGHWPEDFPTPKQIITGKEREELFGAMNYQPPLM